MATTDTRYASTTAGAVPATARRVNALDWIALALVIVGGLNWGLVGAFEFDLVAAIFGDMSALSRIVYVLVGLAAIYMLYFASKLNPRA
jgi:uncharacterized membrane protein YuzA (DUF378 family)